MRFYQKPHEFYCGIDLHTKKMYCCLVDAGGNKLVHRNIDTRGDRFLNLVDPYRDGLVVGVECTFSWYWLADLCAAENIPFVLGHALYMKAIHGGKTKNDKIDSEKIAMLLRGGMFPQAYAYPKEMRGTRDLLRRRMRLMRIRAEALGHLQITNWQYNLPPLGRVCYKALAFLRCRVPENFGHIPGAVRIMNQESVAFRFQILANSLQGFGRRPL